MSHPDDETLAGIALEPELAAFPDGDHVRSCARCTSVVADIRATRDLARSERSAVWEHPDPRLWEGIERTVAEAPAGVDPGDRVGDVASERVRTERADLERALAVPPTAAARRRRSPRRSFSVTWVVAATAAGIIVGLFAAWSFWKAPTTPTTIARTQLDTLDTRQSRGVAALEGSGQELDLRVDAATLDAGGGYLEVWLINTDGKRMISLGVLVEPGSDTFPVSRAIIAQGYLIVDISREPFDGLPQHSSESLARGQLPA